VYTWKDSLANLYLMLLNSGIDLAFRLVYLFIWGVAFTHRVCSWETGLVYWLTLLVAMDFIFYWLHRMEHMVRLFWAVHVTHHSSDQFNLTVGFRSSVLQPLYRFLFFLPLAFLGFKPLDIVFMFSATQTWGILVHTRLIGKLGWLEHFLVTPSHHRVHHASNPKYLDKNMGMLLIIWDKLFGTFQEELDQSSYQPIRYGLTTPLQDPNMRNLVAHEWQAIAKDFRREIPLNLKWKYLFSPPGWSHDGSRRTSEEFRRAETDNEI
jgi:sterol desaturase/sphingolipid hydroxylase (fatty acid hydroxylase superfamily)